LNRKIKTISVFCGSSPGAKPVYKKAAEELGRIIARNNIKLIYGASNLGLMGIVAESVINAGGSAIGVMPKVFVGKVEHPKLDTLIIVETLHERKAKMFELSDAFITLPGGFGTFEEILEIITWAQIGIHNKPFGFLNIAGYYDKLLSFLDSSVEQRFVRKEHRNMIQVSRSASELLELFENYEPPKIDKWLDQKKIKPEAYKKYFSDIGYIEFRKNKKVKHLRITIKSSGEIFVTIPKNVSSKTANEFIQSKTNWIKKHLKKIDERNKFTSQNSDDNLRNTINAEIMLENKINDFSRKYGFLYNRLSFRSQKTRWGSCSAKNNISLNIKLVNLPEELIEYVILHELVHTKIKNHQEEFWNELGKYVRNPRALQTKLKRFNLAKL